MTCTLRCSHVASVHLLLAKLNVPFACSGVSSLGPGMLPVVEDKGPGYPQQQQQQFNQGYQQDSQVRLFKVKDM